MRAFWILPLLAAAAMAAALVACREDAPSSVARGRHLVETMGCADCHTPQRPGPRGPEPDPALVLAGHPAGLEMPPAPSLGDGPWAGAFSGTLTAWSGPWGVSFAANLTPDDETGLGRWTEETFVATMRSGRHLGRGRPILPPMPWPAIAKLGDDDLKAVFAYLRTLPAVSNRVPEPRPPASRP